jgi:NAD(P)-dependent dehydrogenase (short-subunit alcohol dehydrogenase family)
MTATRPLALVSGATDGIGRATAHRLVKLGYRVIIHGRHAEKLAATEAALASHGEVYALRADFASLDDVAGLTDHRQLSRDGFELTFAVNYLAPWLLTHLLLDVLESSVSARIVNVASTAMGGGAIKLDDLQAERSFDGWGVYANSKLANVLFSNLLADRLRGSGVVSNALCPGLIDTNFFHTNTVFANGAYERMQPGMRTPEEGADIPVYLASAAELQGVTGRFFMRGYGYRSGDAFRAIVPDWDRDLAEALWAKSQEYLSHWLKSSAG